jgi:hypothetical protein
MGVRVAKTAAQPITCRRPARRGGEWGVRVANTAAQPITRGGQNEDRLPSTSISTYNTTCQRHHLP